MKPVYVVDIFKEIVGRVSAKLTPALQAYDPNIAAVHYMHGHPIEIIKRLAELDKSKSFKFKRYPLIALFQDFPETYDADPGILGKGRFHMIIARGTDPNFEAEDRYNYNFKPVLYPIYLELLEQISLAPEIMSYSSTQLRHTKIDRLYWGREQLYGNGANIFNDYLDVIEILDLELKFYVKIC